MNSKTKMRYTSEKGITLIALVITIIVLLILAGVTISMVLGDNGIIHQAEHAKDMQEKESELERVKLAITSAVTAGKGEIELDLESTADNSLKKALDAEFEK
jgi:flagellar basal body-associated protein FliL